MTHPLLGGSPEDYRRRQESSHESLVVRTLLTRYGLAAYRHVMLEEDAARTGEEGQLTLLGFFAQFPDFPIYLHSAKQAQLTRHVSVATLLHRFETRRLVSFYTDLLETTPSEYADGNVGLVFAWPQVPQGGLILHRHMDNVLEEGVRLVCRTGHTHLYLETFAQFLSRLDWEHE